MKNSYIRPGFIMQWLKQIYLYRFLYLKDSVNYLKEMVNLKNGKFFPCFYRYIK